MGTSSPRACALNTIRHHAAMVKFGPAPGTMYGVIEATFYGPIDEGTFDTLRRALFAAAGMDTRYVFRLDKALTMLSALPVVPQIPGRTGMPMAAAVTNDEDCMLWYRHAADLERAGCLRLAVFPISGIGDHASAAYQWAEEYARGQ